MIRKHSVFVLAGCVLLAVWVGCRSDLQFDELVHRAGLSAIENLPRVKSVEFLFNPIPNKDSPYAYRDSHMTNRLVFTPCARGKTVTVMLHIDSPVKWDFSFPSQKNSTFEVKVNPKYPAALDITPKACPSEPVLESVQIRVGSQTIYTLSLRQLPYRIDTIRVEEAKVACTSTTTCIVKNAGGCAQQTCPSSGATATQLPCYVHICPDKAKTEGKTADSLFLPCEGVTSGNEVILKIGLCLEKMKCATTTTAQIDTERIYSLRRPMLAGFCLFASAPPPSTACPPVTTNATNNNPLDIFSETEHLWVASAHSTGWLTIAGGKDEKPGNNLVFSNVLLGTKNTKYVYIRATKNETTSYRTDGLIEFRIGAREARPASFFIYVSQMGQASSSR